MSFEHKAVANVRTCVNGPETMLETIREMGIIPFFENIIPGYSIEEMTPKENWFDTQEDLSFTPWDWKIPCVQSGEIAYGKFLLGGKAAFASVEWYAHLRNYRQSLDKYRPDAVQQQILDYLAANGSIGIKEVRGLLGIKKGQADALMTRLMMQCRVVTGDIIRVFRTECGVTIRSPDDVLLRGLILQQPPYQPSDRISIQFYQLFQRNTPHLGFFLSGECRFSP